MWPLENSNLFSNGNQLKSNLDQIWFAILEPAIKKVFCQESLTRTFYMRLYNCVFSCFMLETTNQPHKFPAPAGIFLYGRIENYFKKHLSNIKATADSLHDKELLSFYLKTWKNYQLSCKLINGIFSYLNRNVCREEDSQFYKVYQLGLVIWREVLFESVKTSLTKYTLEQIEKERNGEVIDSSFISGIVQSYTALEVGKSHLSIYKKHFEKQFLEETERFYQMKSEAFLLANNSVNEYPEKAIGWLAEEKKRVDRYLNSSSLGVIMFACNKVLVENHLEKLITEFSHLLQLHTVKDLACLYKLLSLCNLEMLQFQKQFERDIHRQAIESLKELDTSFSSTVNPITYMDTILGVHKKYSFLVEQSFANDLGFRDALDKAFSKFVNVNPVVSQNGKLQKSNAPNELIEEDEEGKMEQHLVDAAASRKSAELVARYFHSILKKSNKDNKDNDTETMLSNALIVFKYLIDKDVFEMYHGKMFACRIVYQQSVSDDTEESIINKLTQICGLEYTSKLATMFQDIRLGKDLNEGFKEFLASLEQTESMPRMDLSVTVLRTASWPFNTKSFPINLPAEMKSQITRFTAFYNKKHSGHKLNWLFGLSKGEVVFKGRYTLQASTYQIAVLLQYQEADVHTVRKLFNATQIKMSILLQVLQLLIKANILKIASSSAAHTDLAISLETELYLFLKYKNKKTHLNINGHLKMESKAEAEQTSARVDECRLISIQAALVRIMKMHRTLAQELLIAAVIRQLTNRFQPDVKVIRKCIDILIEKEYLERSNENPNTYQYLA